MTQPFIDFIIPSFNDSRILRAVRSITAHRESAKFKILIQDGGSDDRLLELLQALLRPQDQVFQERDRGVFDALNKALEKVTAPWVGWIGSDDLLASTFDPASLAHAPSDCALVSWATAFFDEPSMRVTRLFVPVASPWLRKQGAHLPHFSTFVRREAARSERFQADQKNFADQAYFLALERRYRVQVRRQISTYMAAGGVSNASAKGILETNLTVAKALRGEKGRVGATIFVLVKLVYKLVQVMAARRNPTSVPRSLW